LAQGDRKVSSARRSYGMNAITLAQPSSSSAGYGPGCQLNHKAATDAGLSENTFMDSFADLVARRDYSAANALCRARMKDKPNDRCARELLETVQQFVDAVEEVARDDAEDDELPPHLDELQEPAALAAGRAFEAMHDYLQSDAGRIWKLGEQCVGIFWDAGQIWPACAQRDRLREMSVALTRTLREKLLRSTRPSMQEEPSDEALSRAEWVSEGLGLLWWQLELGLEADPELQSACRDELRATRGCMRSLVGFSQDELGRATYSDLCDVVCQTWTLERSFVCGLYSEGEDVPVVLEYGIEQVLAEILRRPLIEAPLKDFYDCFYLMTHVVYVLNCYNGCLPNIRSDCPWLYAYLERSLQFWLREVRRTKHASLPASVAAQMWSAEAVDQIAEAVDCLCGLNEHQSPESAASESIREGLAWLLGQQEEDGFFYSPGQARNPADEYNHLHPTWTAAQALQLDRSMPGPSPRAAAWSRYARQAAQKVNFQKPPPPHVVPEQG